MGNEALVLVLWGITIAGGVTMVVLAGRPTGGGPPRRFGVPGGLVAAHGGIAALGFAGWLALVLSDNAEADVPWMVPALLACVAVALGVILYWRAHRYELSHLDDEPDPALDRPPTLLRYGHGILGIATAIAAVWVALV